MSPAPHDPLRQLSDRLMAVEESLTRVQQVTEDLSDQMLHLGRRLDEAERATERAAARLDDVEEARRNDTNPEDERPPHY